MEIVSKAHATAAEITKLSKKVLQSVTTLTREARWTNKLYTEGVRFDYSDTSLLCCINSLITKINTHFKNDAMSEHVHCLRRITRNQCIHCASFTHESVDHHLSLGIFHVPGNPHPYLYSTPSKKNDVTSQGTPDMLSLHQIHPLPMKPTVSKINATCYRPQVHRCRAHQTYNDHADFIDNDHDDIGSIFGEEVYNNID